MQGQRCFSCDNMKSADFPVLLKKILAFWSDLYYNRSVSVMLPDFSGGLQRRIIDDI